MPASGGSAGRANDGASAPRHDDGGTGSRTDRMLRPGRSASMLPALARSAGRSVRWLHGRSPAAADGGLPVRWCGAEICRWKLGCENTDGYGTAFGQSAIVQEFTYADDASSIRLDPQSNGRLLWGMRAARTWMLAFGDASHPIEPCMF